MTAIRKAVLEIIVDQKSPLSASDIADKITIPCNLVTIYRTLTYLEKSGYITSFILHCPEHGTERYYTPLTKRGEKVFHNHWFHCQGCHTFINLGDCQMESQLERYEKDLGVQITSHTLNVLGFCSSCLSKQEISE